MLVIAECSIKMDCVGRGYCNWSEWQMISIENTIDQLRQLEYTNHATSVESRLCFFEKSNFLIFKLTTFQQNLKKNSKYTLYKKFDFLNSQHYTSSKENSPTISKQVFHYNHQIFAYANQSSLQLVLILIISTIKRPLLLNKPMNLALLAIDKLYPYKPLI